MLRTRMSLLTYCWAWCLMAGTWSLASGQDAGGTLAARIAPLLDDQTIAVAAIDLARINPDVLLARWQEAVPDNGPPDEARQEIRETITNLRGAKVNEVFFVVSLSAGIVPPEPFIAVRPEGAHERPAELLRGMMPNLEQASIGEFLVAGQPETLNRLKTTHRAVPRPELAEAFSAAKDMPLRLAIIPPPDARRALTETLVIPRQFGGDAETPIAQGLEWLAFGLALEPKLDVRLSVRTKDAAAAELLATRTKDLFRNLAAAKELTSVLPNAPRLFGNIRPVARGNTVLVTLAQETAKPSDIGDLFAPIRKAREAARRAQCTNNLKQLALAMHIYYDKNNRLPPTAIRDPDGKPLLSWRVAILPYLDQQQLYQQFHLDEPWDSEHNKTLIAKMPKTLACTETPEELLAQGMTTYLVPTGPDGLFSGPNGPTFREIRDGTSNTIMIVDVGNEHAVTWTKPDDLEVDPAQPHKGLSAKHGAGFTAAFADGSVHFLDETIAAATLKLLLHPNDGMPIPKF